MHKAGRRGGGSIARWVVQMSMGMRIGEEERSFGNLKKRIINETEREPN